MIEKLNFFTGGLAVEGYVKQLDGSSRATCNVTGSLLRVPLDLLPSKESLSELLLLWHMSDLRLDSIMQSLTLSSKAPSDGALPRPPPCSAALPAPH